jgi:hypothetical protein
MALSKKYRDFIDAYMAHGNGARAARDSGYQGKRPDQAAYEYLRKPEVREEIERRTALLIGRTEVVRRIAERSRTSIADVLRLPSTETPASTEAPKDAPRTLLGDDMWQIDLVKAQETGAIHQIKRLKKGKYGDEVEMYDPLPALEILAKYLKLFGELDGILKLIDLTKLTPEQVQRIADGDNPIAVILNIPTTSGTG